MIFDKKISRKLSFLLSLVLIISIGGSTLSAQENILQAKIDNPETLASIIKPSIVKVVTVSMGTIDIPNFIFDAHNLKVVDPKKGDKSISIKINDEIYGSGFIVSSDGTIVTNSHVVLGIVDGYFRALTTEYLKLTSNAEIADIMTRYSTKTEAYDAVYDIVYNYIKKSSVLNLNTKITVLKPYDDSKTLDAAIENGYKAKVLYSNDNYYTDNNDVAVLKIEADNLPTVPLALDTDKITTGQKINAFGFPSTATFGKSDFLESTFSQGLISAIKHQGDVDLYQTDAKISSGSSGGPMVNEYGQIVGIMTFISGDTSKGDNFGFAIPISLVNKVLKSNDIKINDGSYFTHYKKGLALVSILKCKKAIDEFTLASKVNSDFSVDKYTSVKIKECNDIISSGKSIDSSYDEIKDFMKNHTMAIVLTILLIIVGITIFFIIRYLVKRMNKDEQSLKEIISHEHTHDATGVQPIVQQPTAPPVAIPVSTVTPPPTPPQA